LATPAPWRSGTVALIAAIPLNPIPFLNSIPVAALAIGVIGLSAGFAFLGVHVVRRLMRGRVAEGHNDVLAPIFVTAGTIYAVLIGFLVIIVWEQYVSTKAVVADEASALTIMYRQTDGMPSGERQQMRQILRDYTNAVVNDEWLLQAHGATSPKVDAAISTLYGTFGNLDSATADSAINSDFVRNASAVAANRNKRILQSEDRFPGVLWFGLMLGGVLVVSMSFLLYMQRLWLHVLMSSALASLIGVLLFILIVLNHPLSGQLAITTHDYESALSAFTAVDRGH
jgi:hypothetical protein